MITKVCHYHAHEEGEPLVRVFQPGQVSDFVKTSAPLQPDVQRYMEKLKPDPRKIYVLVNALGAGEFWGSNINGDWFPENALIHEGMDYGYKTFLNSHCFAHHVNKDPAKSFGDVELSVWHPDMKRVELVIAVDRDRALRLGAPHVIDKLDQGQFPDVSMGCKVPYDLCSVCTDWKKYRAAQATFNPDIHQTIGKAVLAFHRKNPIRGVSVTRNDYCEHLKNLLNKILPDGKKVYAINDFPRFFDISFVFIGADKTAKVMMKLAHAYGQDVMPSWLLAEHLGHDQPAVDKGFEKAAAAQMIDLTSPQMTGPSRRNAKLERVLAKLREKRASQDKGAEITKEVPVQFGSKAVPVIKSEKDLSNSALDAMGKHDSLSESLSTASSMGMLLKPREFQRVVIIRLGMPSMADELDRRNQVFSPTDDIDGSVPVVPGKFSDMIKKILLPFMQERSCLGPVMQRRIIKVSLDKPKMTPEPEHVENDEILNKVAASYNSYIDQAITCTMNSDSVHRAHPDLWQAVTGVSVADSFDKTAAGLVNPASLALGGAGAGYLLSRWAKWERTKATMGAREPVGIITNTLADTPELAMAAGAMLGGHYGGSRIPRAIVGGARDAVVGGVNAFKRGL